MGCNSGTMTVLDALRSVSAYPVPQPFIEAVAQERMLDLASPAYSGTIGSAAYRLALADIYSWIAVAPDVSQGGQSYSFTDEQRQLFRSRAAAIYGAYGTDDGDAALSGTVYGYKGSRL